MPNSMTMSLKQWLLVRSLTCTLSLKFPAGRPEALFHLLVVFRFEFTMLGYWLVIRMFADFPMILPSHLQARRFRGFSPGFRSHVADQGSIEPVDWHVTATCHDSLKTFQAINCYSAVSWYAPGERSYSSLNEATNTLILILYPRSGRWKRNALRPEPRTRITLCIL